MKTRKETKERKQEREIKTVNLDMRKEFEYVMVGDDILDEIALAECLCSEDEE